MRDRELLRKNMSVYFVVGSQDCGYSAANTIAVVDEALAGGVGMIQLRDKGSRLSDEERFQL
jgi:thiamine-phosphate pyrophosphorylase